MRIIDAHSHIFPAKIAQKATDSIGKFYDIPMALQAGEPERLSTCAKKAGIDRCVVCSTATKPEQVASINAFITDACGRDPAFVGLATMHPGYGDISGELALAKARGLHGVKLHPDFQAFLIDDPAAYPIYETAQALGMPILFHAGDKRYPYSQPARICKVARDFPQLVCVAAHFGGYSVWNEVECYQGVKNVYMDTSSSLMFLAKGEAERLIHLFGAEHFMFGTDFPMWEPHEELERFNALVLTQAEREQIFHKTAEAVFGIR